MLFINICIYPSNDNSTVQPIHLYIVWVFILTTQIQNKNTVVIIPFSQVRIHTAVTNYILTPYPI